MSMGAQCLGVTFTFWTVQLKTLYDLVENLPLHWQSCGEDGKLIPKSRGSQEDGPVRREIEALPRGVDVDYPARSHCPEPLTHVPAIKMSTDFL